jgi:2-polyprenyl-3-methyl-5-hydroxy-6-metoxy-1,4-benzoquinol methylase
MVKPTEEQIEAGQFVYTKTTLLAYDIIVLGISNTYIWQCQSMRLKKHYDKYVSANHLDIGVGTGYFLEQCKFPSQTPRIALMDLNPNTLVYTSKRISRYKPETYRQNVLEPISINIQQFDSVGINYLLHCLPGSISEKAVVFDHLKSLMNQDAVVFGSTILQSGVPKSWVAQRLMNFYNKKGIFANTEDSLTELEKALKERFKEVQIDIVGCVALFSGRYSL